MKKNIVFIGGGTGISSVLKDYSEVRNTKYKISAIISMFDSGGSTGLLRKEFGILPMGDVRQVMLSLSPDSILKKLFEYRFDDKKSIHAHNVGNLIITALRELEGSEKKAFKEFSKILDLKEDVVPITWDNANINVKYENGKILNSEHEIDDLYNSHVPQGFISKVWLSPKPSISTEARKKLEHADYIVIGPGDLYLSIICNFLVEGFSEALLKSNTKIIYISNLVNKRGQTEEFYLSDYISELNKYLKVKKVDYVIYSSSVIPDLILKRYKKLHSDILINNMDGKNVIVADLVSKIIINKRKSDRLFRGYIRHNSILTLQTLFELINKLD